MGASTTPASLWIPAVGLRRSIARCTFSISTSPGASPSSKGALDFLGVPSFGFCHDFRTSRYPAPKTNTNQVVSDYVEIPRTLSSVDSEEARFRACFSLLLSSKADHWKPLNAILNVWSAPRRESDTLSPGNAITTVETPFGMIGVGICYDMRFPELSMAMRAAGSVLLCFPGAFNMTTGPAHWELLQRARALDNQVFVQPSDASLFSRGPSTFFRFCREFWSEMFALRLRGVEFPNPVCRRCAFLCVSARLFSTRGLDRHDSRPVAYLKPASPLHDISLPFRTVLRDNCISRTKPGLQVSGMGAQLRGRPVGHGRGDHGARQRDGACRGRRRSGAGGPEGHPGVAPEEARLVQAGVAVNFLRGEYASPFPFRLRSFVVRIVELLSHPIVPASSNLQYQHFPVQAFGVGIVTVSCVFMPSVLGSIHATI